MKKPNATDVEPGRKPCSTISPNKIARIYTECTDSGGRFVADNAGMLSIGGRMNDNARTRSEALDEQFGKALLNKKQLAARLATSIPGVEFLMRRRKIPVIRLGHRTVRFSWEKVQAALAKLT